LQQQKTFFFPWPLLSQVKTDRLGYIHKLFYAEMDQMTAQEHMELDSFFSEFDMPTRWGLLRIKVAWRASRIFLSSYLLIFLFSYASILFSLESYLSAEINPLFFYRYSISNSILIHIDPCKLFVGVGRT
jgi:hypothetical protein